METMSEFSKRIEDLMAEPSRGWDRTMLAHKVGISYQGVKKLLDGGGVGVDTLFKLAKALNVSPYWLYTGEGERSTWAQSVGGTVSTTAALPVDSPLSQKAVALGMLYDTAPQDDEVRALLFRRASAALLGFEHPSGNSQSAPPVAVETLKKSDV